MSKLKFLLVALTLSSVIGCDASRNAPKTTAQPTEPATHSESTAPTGAETTAAAPAADVKINLTDFDQLKQTIAGYKDRVVVVDAWSTSCLPCMKEFPHLVELARRWPEDVVCVSVNLDFAGLPDQTPEKCLPGVTKFLKAKSADPANLFNFVSTETDETMFAKLEIESIPAIFVYDRAGAVTKLTVDSVGGGEMTYAGNVIPLVEKLIEK